MAAGCGTPTSGCHGELKVNLGSLTGWCFPLQCEVAWMQTWGKQRVGSTKIEVLEDSNKWK